MTAWYGEDLAYIHDVGFRDYALKSAPGILDILKHREIQSGLIVELGCGSGLSTEILHQSGYQVLGIDISAAMVAIAQTRVPTAEFRVDSLFTAEIPPCCAVISIGECLSYAFDANSDAVLEALFQRIYQTLLPGGVFIFDVVVPGHAAPGEVARHFTEGQDWIVLVEKQEDPIQQLLTRRIIALRQVGDLYRRTDEVHFLRLFNMENLAKTLRQNGFQVDITDRYGAFSLPPARMVAIAYKPI
ncbi:class I SAM-dependent methyltransferase [Altericista sp. CCNU0014]|uniref:class I SAM-dependent methyltransferase n=1 Tax=Altericista sp. CCNU0014 TaxID=3082949 RepID=UPI00384E82E3